ncbi:hypothetical protein C27AD_10456 [Salinisphaera hydrothermalis C27AD]
MSVTAGDGLLQIAQSLLNHVHRQVQCVTKRSYETERIESKIELAIIHAEHVVIEHANQSSSTLLVHTPITHALEQFVGASPRRLHTQGLSQRQNRIFIHD